MKAAFVLLLLSCLFVHSVGIVAAIGIGPADTTVDFQSDTEMGFTNIVLNNRDQDMPVSVFADQSSDLYPFLVFPENRSFVIPSFGRTTFTYKLKLPSALDSPGLHTIQVGVVEGISTGGMIGTVTAATTRLRVRVPYPGKYLEPSLEVSDVEENDTVRVKVVFRSRGTEVVDRLTVKGQLLSQDDPVGEISFNETLAINPRDTVTLEGLWPTKGRPVGQYKVIVAYAYDGQEGVLKGFFNVGKQSIDILSMPTTVEQDLISPFDIKVKSLWNFPVDGVYAVTVIYQSGSKVEEITSPTVSLVPWQEDSLKAYWDTKGVPVGNYDALVTVHFLNTSVSKQGKVTVTPGTAKRASESPKGVSTTMLLVVVIGLLVIAIIINTVILMRRKH